MCFGEQSYWAEAPLWLSMLGRGVCICVLADTWCPGIAPVILQTPEAWCLKQFYPASCQPPLFRDPGTRRLRGKGPPLLHFSININISAFSADCWSTTAHSQLSLGPNFCANLSNDLMVICWDAALCISGIPPVTMCHNSGDWAWEARATRHWRLFSNNKMLNMQNVARTDDRMHNCAILTTIHQKTITNNLNMLLVLKVIDNTLSVQINLICYLHS